MFYIPVQRPVPKASRAGSARPTGSRFPSLPGHWRIPEAPGDAAPNLPGGLPSHKGSTAFSCT